MSHSGHKVNDNSILEPNILRGNMSAQLRGFANQAWNPTAHLRILDSIKYDHRDIIGIYELIVKCTDSEERTKWQNMFTWELARHAVAEELVVYPAFKKYLEDGEEMAEKDRAQHQLIKEQLHLFQDLPSNSPRFIPCLESLIADFKFHIHEEETGDIARLDEALNQEESVALSRSLDRTKMFVPTRSHPMAPSKPPFETPVGLLTAPVDYLGDLLRKWPDRGGPY